MGRSKNVSPVSRCSQHSVMYCRTFGFALWKAVIGALERQGRADQRCHIDVAGIIPLRVNKQTKGRRSRGGSRQQAAGKSSWLSKSAGRMYEPASAVAVPCHCGDVGVVHDIPTPNMRPPQHAAHHNNAAQRLSNLQFTTTLTGALSNNTTAGHAFRSDGTPLR